MAEVNNSWGPSTSMEVIFILEGAAKKTPVIRQDFWNHE